MAISTTFGFASVDELMLDPTNPRLGRARIEEHLEQAEIISVMREWKLEELAISYLEGGGFWPQEALLVVMEDVGGKNRKVVVEGNRRVAALLLLRDAYEMPDESSVTWRRIAESAERPAELFEKIPYLLAESREDVDAFLGFRHVTGIKEWHPAEKASYIARLVEDRHCTYEQVMRKIGSKTPTVRQNYIAFGIMRQISQEVEAVDRLNVEDRFSVMYLSLRTKGVQAFLGVNLKAEPSAAATPVTNTENLQDYAIWLFGTAERPPLFTDSRLTDKFGQVLESNEAIDYLKRNERPVFEVAYQTAGGDELEIVDLLRTAADDIELSLGRVHLYRKSGRIIEAVDRVSRDALQLLSVFPDLRDELIPGKE